jgi:phospholipase/carboxylesterase
VIVVERPAGGEPEGALVLIHGRGATEHDLLPLVDVLDPKRRLHGYCPRGPFTLPPGGAQWYVVHRVGYPDAPTFAEGLEALTSWLDSLPHERIVVGGFSQGAVMSFAAGLGRGRPRPSAVIGFSGFIPEVEGWELDAGQPFPPIAIGHGTFDAVIPVEFAHRAVAKLEQAGASPLYRESPIDHKIDPAFLLELRPWLRDAIGGG